MDYCDDYKLCEELNYQICTLTTVHRPNSEVFMVSVPISTALEKIAQIYISVISAAFCISVANSRLH